MAQTNAAFIKSFKASLAKPVKRINTSVSKLEAVTKKIEAIVSGKKTTKKTATKKKPVKKKPVKKVVKRATSRTTKKTTRKR